VHKGSNYDINKLKPILDIYSGLDIEECRSAAKLKKANGLLVAASQWLRRPLVATRERERERERQRAFCSYKRPS